MQVDFIFTIAVLIISVILHEISHGYAAYFLGDSTAKYAGRLTLNPLKHLDIFGSVILPLILVITRAGFIIGWAKPVPFNPYNLKNKKWGLALVGISGPATNFLLAGFFGLSIRLNDALVFLPASFSQLAGLIVLINLTLGIFNLIPIPPLDGSRLVSAFLPYRFQKIQFALEKYAFIFVLIFIFFAWQYLLPIIVYLFRIITGLEIY